MIKNTTPQLDPSRVDQMINTAMSYAQDPRRAPVTLASRLGLTRSPLAWTGFGAALAAAAIAAVMWIEPAQTPILRNADAPPQDIALDADISDYILYDVLEELS